MDVDSNSAIDFRTNILPVADGRMMPKNLDVRLEMVGAHKVLSRFKFETILEDQ